MSDSASHRHPLYSLLVTLVAVLLVTSVAAAPVAGAGTAGPAAGVTTSGGPVKETPDHGTSTIVRAAGNETPVSTAATESEPNDDGPSADPLPIGEPVNATLASGSDLDYFRFQADRGQELELTVSVPNASQGLRIEVFEEGDSLATFRTGLNPGAQPRTFTDGVTLDANTTYFLIVDSGLNWDGPANYSVTVELDDLAPEEPNEVEADATPYTLGTNRSAERTLGDTDVYRFQAERGAQLNASLFVPNRSKGGRLQVFEAGASIERAYLETLPGESGGVQSGDMLETTGTYYAIVDPGRSFDGTFNYSFTITTEPAGFTEPNEVPADATRLTPDPAPGARGGFGDDDVYRVRAQAGETVSVNFTGPPTPAGETTTLFVNQETAAGDFGTEELRLDSSGGQQSGSFSAPETGSYLVNVPTRPGTYEFDVTVGGETLGVPNDRFELNENRGQADANASISLGTYEGLSVVNDDVDVFAVDLTAGDSVTVATTFDAADGDPSLELLDAGGTVVASGSTTATGREVTYAVPSNGTYYVRVAGTGSGTVPYDLSVRVPTTVTVAPSPQSLTATPDGNASVDVVVTGATAGVSAYDVSIGVNASVATISSVAPTGAAGPADVTITPDGSTATVNASGVGLAASSGATTLASVSLATANATGESNLTVTVDSVTDQSGFAYLTAATNGSLSVQSGPGDVGQPSAPATDPLSGPGYEDVNGDGRANFQDVISVAFLLGDLPPEKAQFFDFDDNGQFNFVDVIELVFRI
jgi:hypothetical protein